jgi:hypothetical protein
MVLDDPTYFDAFDRVAIDRPSITVDTTDGYDPSLAAVIVFLNRSRGNRGRSAPPIASSSGDASQIE